jgi:hypothetical protein
MSTAPTTAPPTVPTRNYDEFIESHVRKTQSYLRLVEVASAMMCIVAATLAYLIAVAVIDHWLLRGGLGVVGRTVAFSLLALGVLAYAARTLLPHLRYRVNPVYAADKIERAAPSLQNSLLNFLLLRRHHPGVPEVVFRGLEQQTAAGVAQVPVESTVDRGRLLRIGYVLIGVLAVAALYKVFSPKDIFPSVGRVLAPWADIAPVTRVRIKNVKPGDGEAVLLSQVRVSAEVSGLAEDEQVKLIYSTLDKQVVDVEIPMYLEAGERAHRCLLPEEKAGLGQDVAYRIEAGDCVTRTYRITAVAAPTIRVTSIEYEYPAYTELGTRRLEGVGDIKAIDGTKVTIRAEASQEIARANIEVEGPRGESKPMRHVGRAANGEIALSRKTDGNDSMPEQTAYRLRFTTPGGDANENPIRHKIEIIPDKPPLVEILKPAQPDVELPADAELYIDVRARDPDFRLGGMRLAGRKEDRPLFDDDLLEHVEKENGRLGDAHRATFRFVPARFQLKSGDVVHYQAVATDNKTPNPNRSETPEFRIKITDPQRTADQNADDQQPQQPNQPQDADDPMAKEGGRKPDGQQGEGAGGEQGNESGEDSSGKSGGKSGGDADSADSKEQTEPPQNGDGQKGSGDQQDPQPADPKSGDQSGDGEAQTDPARDGTETAEGERGGARPDDAQPQNGSRPDPSAGAEPQEGIDSEGDAFDEIAKHLQQKEQGNEQKPGEAKSKPSDGASQGENAEPGERKDDASKGTAGEATDSGSDTGGQNGDNAQTDDRTTADSEKPTPKPDNQAANEKKPDDNGPQADQESGAGAKKSQKDGGGGKGNPGDTPPPPPEGRSQPKDKSGENTTAPNSKSEPMDSSTSDKESDSAEGNEGSRSGKGKEGGGEQSKQPGEGTEGSNTPSDSGGNTSQESGKGENSTRGGDDTPTDAETGKPSDQPGDASESQDGSKGQGAGEKQPSGQQPTPQDKQGSPDNGQSPDAEGGEKGEGQPGSESAGSGRRGSPKSDGQQSLDRNPTPPGGRPNTSVDPQADDANLEYARKQTELVLDYLEDQLDKGGVDPELKEKFGWTDEQFREFVRRHSQLRQRAQLEGKEGDRARAEWDESLRSLGLRRPDPRTRTGTPTEEKTPGLSDFNRTRIPQEFQDEVDAFRRDAFRN